MLNVQRNFNNHWEIYRNQDKNWMRREPWRDENGNLIPNFIDNIAMRLPFYKDLQQRFPNNPELC